MSIRFFRRTNKILSILGVLLCPLFLYLWIFHQRRTAHLPPNPWAESEIPNIVHYIHILPPHIAENAPSLKFEFRQFLSFYSVYLYLRPDKIFVHTNALPKVIQATKRSHHQWTYVIANLPTLEFLYVEAPTHTSAGLPLNELAHRADFVRTKVLKKWGGIYIDEDMYFLKDISELRFSGFHNVVGREYKGGINNGMILSIPESDLITAFNALQDGAFDGRWSTHGVELLTQLVLEFSPREYQVLILEQSAFFPLDWEDGIDTLYYMHEGDDEQEPETEHGNVHPFNMTTLIDSFQYQTSPTWHYDWRASYAVHGWNHILWNRGHLFGDYGGISLNYVLARNSNFARAMYPAVRHALDNGVIKTT